MQTLQERSGSGLVTIPKRFLERDGLLDEDGKPRRQSVTVDRLDEGVYAVRICDGDVPEVEETEKVQRLIAHAVMNQGPSPRAD